MALLKSQRIYGMGALGRSVWPGITMLTPRWSGPSADVRGGMGFGLHGLGDYAKDASGDLILDSSGNPVSTSDTSTISDLVTKGLALLNSQQVFQLNLQRAQQGLGPINVPSPQINLGIAGINSSTLLLIGAGLLGVLLLKRR